MKRRLRTFLVICSLTLISFVLYGCGAHTPNDIISGGAFAHYKDLYVNNELYSIFVIENVSYLEFDELNPSQMIIKYDYREYEIGDVNSWKINYLDTYSYYADFEADEEVLKQFYDSIESVLSEYESFLDFEFETYYNNTELEKEYTFTNIKEYKSVLLIDAYIPFRVINNRQTFTIFVPVKTFQAYRDFNDNLIISYNEERDIKIGYKLFVSSNAVKLN